MDETNTKKSNKGYWWFGIAASLVGVLLIVSFLMNSNDNKNSHPTIVDTEKVDQVKPNNVVNQSNDQNIEELKDNEDIEKTNLEKINNTPNSPSGLKEQLIKEQNKLVTNKIDEAVSQSSSIKEEQRKNEKPEAVSTLTFEDQKVKDVVAQIKELQSNNASVSEAEIDALLYVAQKEITLKKLYDHATKTVDADALLRDVEEDLEQSFRARVYKMLRSGYEDVKTAVAQRNN